jgi:hypothetical protein
MKPVPMENKGLAKLPKDVRNKMGYMAKGGMMKGYMGGGMTKRMGMAKGGMANCGASMKPNGAARGK